MFNLVQPMPTTFRGKVNDFLYRLADRIRPLSDDKVVIAAAVGYVLAIVIGWPE